MQSKFIDWRADVHAEEDRLSLTYPLNSSHYPQLDVLTRSRMKMLRKLFAQMSAPVTPAKRYYAAPRYKLPGGGAEEPGLFGPAAGEPSQTSSASGLSAHPAVKELLGRLRETQPQSQSFADSGPLEELGGAALDSPELYVLSRSGATGGLELLYFHPHGDCLQSLGPIEEERSSALFDPSVAPAPLEGAMFIAANLRRTLQLFGERGYRLSLLEGGRLTERLAACAPGTGCRLQPLLGFYDNRVHELLGLDGHYEVVLSCLMMHKEAESR
ncbi:hypothetical protein [Paenibacillus herberti]|uniref:Nitroreductase domain-containing protein n=1 Tax=Paenibacillus herberti TaxID=1619309 RepID=A0A229NYB9_9BACL|nr:hypothetical protein [Paenibacillus herberti]OXM14794.1 hypothetical protein CGZ75_18150 [Paenibacillus herberti]